MAVSKRLRYEILRRDNHACRYCGAVAPDTVLTVDHVVATALGGTDEPTNLVAACKDCNSGKSATPADASLVADVDSEAARWARAMRLAADLAMIERETVTETTETVAGILRHALRFLPANMNDSIEQFMRAGLMPDEITDSAYTALANDRITASSTWRYFCGVCWRKVERRQQQARELLDTGTTSEPESEYPPCDGNHAPITGEVRYAARMYCALARVCDQERPAV